MQKITDYEAVTYEEIRTGIMAYHVQSANIKTKTAALVIVEKGKFYLKWSTGGEGREYDTLGELMKYERVNLYLLHPK